MSNRARQVAFVRAAMVGRQGLTQAALLDAFAAAGATHPVSHLATGNVSFECAESMLSGIRAGAQRRIAEVIGREEPIFVRSLATLRRRLATRPFDRAPWEDPHERCISFTRVNPQRLELPQVSPRHDACLFDRVAGDVYSVTRLQGGRPGAPGALLERLLGQPVTTRNWNTIERIVARLGT